MASPFGSNLLDSAAMIQTLMKNWWLLAICGLFDAAYSVFNLFMIHPEGSLRVTVGFLGEIALLAAVCTIAAGLWSARGGRAWLLVLNGLALASFGLLSVFWTHRRLSFLPVALLFVVMAGSIAALAWSVAPALRDHFADQWLLAAARFVALAFAVGFVVFGFGFVRFEPPAYYFIWMSSFFAFSAACMLALGLRLNHLRSAFPRLAH
jgi:uncharacterized membrane protein HdeD (DUF308 family)